MIENNIEPPYDERSPEPIVSDLVEEATDAYNEIASYTQTQIDELVLAIAKRIHEASEPIAKVTKQETRIGDIDDKQHKIRLCCKGIADDIIGEPSVGIRETDRENIIEIAKPVGVIGASVPSTNAGPTITNVVMLAIKGGNAVIISTPPQCIKMAALVVKHIQEALTATGAPPALVQLLPGPVNRTREHEMMDQVDLVQVTGSSRKVKSGQESGTPNYCVGEGNVVAIVDETAAIEQTAKQIATGTAFENGILCVCENALVAHTDIYSQLLETLKEESGYVCTADEAESIRQTLLSSGSVSLWHLGKPASKITEKAGIDTGGKTDFLVVEGDGIGPEYPLSGEILAPVLTAYEVDTFEEAVTTTKRILEYEGAGHSCVIHTTRQDRIELVGHDIDVCRVGVNRPSIDLAASYSNDLINTSSLGAGPWGGNQLDENLSYEHFITTTRVALPTGVEEPTAEEIFHPDEHSTCLE